MTFRNYIYKVLAPEKSKEERREYLDHFVDYLREQKHPLYEQVWQDFDHAKKSLAAQESIIFKSFYELVRYLDQEKVSYSVILRSFGTEVFEIRDEINFYIKADRLQQALLPAIAEDGLLDVGVAQPMNATCESEAFFRHEGQFREGKLHFAGKIFEDPSAIYQQLRRVGHTAIQDDWKFWNSHAEASNFGKPFLISQGDKATLAIFFDDNIDLTGSAQNIVGPLAIETHKPISFQALAELGQVVSVDTLAAISNPNYYIERVQEALARYWAQTEILE